MKSYTYKAVILFFVCISAISCKKNYSCRCSTTIAWGTQNDIYSTKTEKLTAKVNKEQAIAICNHEAENINTTYYNMVTNNGQWPSSTVFNTNCVVE